MSRPAPPPAPSSVPARAAGLVLRLGLVLAVTWPRRSRAAGRRRAPSCRAGGAATGRSRSRSMTAGTRRCLAIAGTAHDATACPRPGSPTASTCGVARGLARIAARFPIGNHTYSPLVLPDLSRRVRREIGPTSTGRGITGRPMAPLLRPPFGATDKRVVRIAGELGYDRPCCGTPPARTPRARTARGAARAALRGGPVHRAHALRPGGDPRDPAHRHRALRLRRLPVRDRRGAARGWPGRRARRSTARRRPCRRPDPQASSGTRPRRVGAAHAGHGVTVRLPIAGHVRALVRVRLGATTSDPVRRTAPDARRTIAPSRCSPMTRARWPSREPDARVAAGPRLRLPRRPDWLPHRGSPRPVGDRDVRAVRGWSPGGQLPRCRGRAFLAALRGATDGDVDATHLWLRDRAGQLVIARAPHRLTSRPLRPPPTGGCVGSAPKASTGAQGLCALAMRWDGKSA